jgi:hypothetical protein
VEGTLLKARSRIRVVLFVALVISSVGWVEHCSAAKKRALAESHERIMSFWRSVAEEDPSVILDKRDQEMAWPVAKRLGFTVPLHPRRLRELPDLKALEARLGVGMVDSLQAGHESWMGVTGRTRSSLEATTNRGELSLRLDAGSDIVRETLQRDFKQWTYEFHWDNEPWDSTAAADLDLAKAAGAFIVDDPDPTHTVETEPGSRSASGVRTRPAILAKPYPSETDLRRVLGEPDVVDNDGTDVRYVYLSRQPMGYSLPGVRAPMLNISGRRRAVVEASFDASTLDLFLIEITTPGEGLRVGCRFSKPRDPFLTTFSKPFPPSV